MTYEKKVRVINCRQGSQKNEQKKVMKCPVCLIDFKDSGLMSMISPCHHLFCQNCAEKWLYKMIREGKVAKCPTCRRKIRKIPAASIMGSEFQPIILDYYYTD